ncbi:PIG-X [Mycena polygramma]|nr:PIG-X [Mycena polygramma]
MWRTFNAILLLQPQSAHPVFKTSVEAPGYDNCSLHLHYVLPRIVFVDPYELNNRADAYTFKHDGPSNLELPVFPLPVDGTLDVEVPLHVRYGATAQAGEAPFVYTQLPWPDVFFACPTSVSSESKALLPRMRRSFAAAFEAPSTSIISLPSPPGASPFESIRTPVGNAADVARVELDTAVVVLAAFFYLTTMPTMLEVSSTPYHITWDTDFPEPELSNALRTAQKALHEDRVPNKDRLPPIISLTCDIGIIWELLYHFRVPAEEIDSRMEAMGVLPVWLAMTETEFPPPPGTPQREAGDTSPFVWK